VKFTICCQLAGLFFTIGLGLVQHPVAVAVLFGRDGAEVVAQRWRQIGQPVVESHVGQGVRRGVGVDLGVVGAVLVAGAIRHGLPVVVIGVVEVLFVVPDAVGHQRVVVAPAAELA
jgi:hypothetical protein